MTAEDEQLQTDSSHFQSARPVFGAFASFYLSVVINHLIIPKLLFETLTRRHFVDHNKPPDSFVGGHCRAN